MNELLSKKLTWLMTTASSVCLVINAACTTR